MATLLTPRRAAAFRAALQMAVGATVALFLATALSLPHPYWSVISAIVVIQTSVGGGVLAVARDRAAGTVTGALIGAAAAFVRPPGLEGMALAIAVTTATIAFFGASRPWLKIAPVTAAIVIAGGTGTEGPAALALDRVMEILTGSAVGVAAILALFPRHARDAFRLQAREATAETAALLASIIDGHAPLPEQLRRHDSLKRKLDALGSASKAVIDLPGPQRETADREALVRTLWRVRSDIVILGRGFQTEGAIDRLGPWAEDAQRAVARLESLSRGEAGPSLGEADVSLALSQTGGADLAQGAAAIGLTHLRRDLDDLTQRYVDLGLA